MTKRDLFLSVALIFLILSLPLILILIRQKTFFTPRAEFSDAVFSIQPQNIELLPGEETTLQINLNTNNIQLSGIDLSFIFSPQTISITQIQADPEELFTDKLVNQINTESARLVLLARKNTAQLSSGYIPIAQITIKAQNPGSTTLTIQSRQITGYNNNEQDVLLSPAGVTQANIVIQENPQQQTPAISFKTAFIGLGQASPNMTVKLSVVNELELKPEKTIFNPVVEPDFNKIYSLVNAPLVLTNVSSGQGKTILLKGPKHLQKKAGDRIELFSGENPLFDWTAQNLRLEPGDLPNPAQNWEQDGVANMVDAALLLSRIGSTNNEDLQVADLNYDNIVNTNDLSLLIETLSTRYDDEY